MADQRIQSTERMVGAGHATLADTLNRLALVEHNTDGTHKNTAVVLTGEKGAINGVATLDAGGTVPDAQIPAAIARDTEVASAITTHEAAANPHPTYATDADLSAHVAAADPHTVYALDTDLSTHAGAADPHAGYQKESEKGVASGYASLGADVIVPTAQLGSGTADSTKFLRGDKSWAAPAGGATDKDWSYFRNVGVTPFESWYVAAQISVVSVTVATPTANNMRAVPFMSGRGGTLDRIGIEVTTAVAGNIRIGIYDNTSDTYLYPKNLLVDSGSLNTSTTGMKTAIINLALNPNSLYWFVILNDAAPSIRYLTGGGCAILLGVGPVIGATMSGFLTVSQVFGALPATFTTGGGPTATSSAPAISCRYSA